jgi:hypothetical protein
MSGCLRLQCILDVSPPEKATEVSAMFRSCLHRRSPVDEEDAVGGAPKPPSARSVGRGAVWLLFQDVTSALVANEAYGCPLRRRGERRRRRRRNFNTMKVHEADLSSTHHSGRGLGAGEAKRHGQGGPAAIKNRRLTDG